ncbi:hypothetical protein NITUZ_40349 [Candidatus Nitrosotenuis uzonensis]|uniref:Uncharacterized protein n=1 Tax=Candidatus Nitrosotenuis uzonensis TaxID=1407055 RepID=V6AUQ6_9ARCH|nr:hypothetical protein NITUZ_40349 [Candidatus Nitrosotenuis uzonensis]
MYYLILLVSQSLTNTQIIDFGTKNNSWLVVTGRIRFSKSS